MDNEEIEAIAKLYNEIDTFLRERYNVDEYSSNYIVRDGSLELKINYAEFCIEFGREVTIIINFWQKDQTVIPLYFDKEIGWTLKSYSQWNQSDNNKQLDTQQFNRIIRHFEQLSKKTLN